MGLSRHIFQPPTFNYKTGIVFPAYLSGYQPNFHMLGSQETARSQSHLARLFVLADQAGCCAIRRSQSSACGGIWHWPE